MSCDSEVMGGTAFFEGTCMPIKALFDYLETGKDLNPGVTNQQVLGLLAMARVNLTGLDEATA